MIAQNCTAHSYHGCLDTADLTFDKCYVIPDRCSFINGVDHIKDDSCGVIVLCYVCTIQICSKNKSVKQRFHLNILSCFG